MARGCRCESLEFSLNSSLGSRSSVIDTLFLTRPEEAGIGIVHSIQYLDISALLPGRCGKGYRERVFGTVDVAIKVMFFELFLGSGGDLFGDVGPVAESS